MSRDFRFTPENLSILLETTAMLVSSVMVLPISYDKAICSKILLQDEQSQAKIERSAMILP